MDPDEGRYNQIPREMLLSGDFITPHLNGVEYFEKPAFQYWFTAIMMKFSVLQNLPDVSSCIISYRLHWSCWIFRHNDVFSQSRSTR